MTAADRSPLRRAGAVLLCASTLCLAGPVQPAGAENFFEMLFGGFHRRAPEPLPPQTSSFADPFGSPGHGRGRIVGDASGSFGRGTVYCVRTCDGRYFPLRRHAGASPAALCHAFCPAAKTMVFSGSKIGYAVAPNGARYANLPNAFVYRDKVVDNCTCNGKDGLGLARIDPATDPTLRRGDIVATVDGFESFRGRNKSDAAEFSPINPSSSEWARKLSETKVRPAPPMHALAPVADNASARVHASRRQAAR